MKFNRLVASQRIKELAGRINDLARQAVPLYLREVDLIIASGCKDRRRIEHVLDGMLDFGFDKRMHELYRRLCKYYFNIHQVAAVEYVRSYRDMWETKVQSGKRFNGVITS